MAVIVKLVVTLIVFILMYIVVRRLYGVFSDKREIQRDEKNINMLNILLEDETLDKETRGNMLAVKAACQHDINVRKGVVKLKSGWRPG
ncbi:MULTISPECIES: hypothetical protein [Enterobacteriaceae]|uniref:hypothetical protein n=1 Tax=Enterobacteriaceae TaxID=543 RepID=UPI000515809A|nr:MULTISPECIES: hypothetical protein [Enterobacteriaceae]HAL5940601.1 hypothetical protein [Escherichia coli]